MASPKHSLNSVPAASEHSQDTQATLGERGKTLVQCLILDSAENPTRILLGRKMIGFGVGKWTLFGGHVDPGEDVQSAVIREVDEECGLAVHALEERGTITFHMAGDSVVTTVYLFVATRWSGEVRESDEMKPHWFALETIPYDKMWADDAHWLPDLIAGKRVAMTFWYDEMHKLIKTATKTVAP